MSTPLVEIKDACRTFADRPALHDISLNIDAGEIVALLGPNGAGKTTLMRAIAGRLRLDSGSLRVAGMDPVKDRNARRLLGIVPQAIALYPQLTVHQNLDVLARLSGLKGRAIAVAVDQALDAAALKDRAGDRLTDLSGGMQRRINIVAGTLHGPKLLLLDEPTVGLDLQSRESVHDLLCSLRDQGIGALLSTHDFDQAAAVADRAAFMAGGQMLLNGPVDELIMRRFGDSKEAVIALAQPATPGVEAVLVDHGLSAASDDDVWRGPLTGGYSRLADLESRLEQEGAHVAEMRIREPGLGSVFVQLMQEGTAE